MDISKISDNIVIVPKKFHGEINMKKTAWVKLFGLMTVFALIFVLSTDTFAQGKGKGNGNGNSNVNKGKKDKDKNSDDSLWEGFPDDKNKKNRGNKDDWKDNKNNNSQRFKGLSKKLGVSPDYLQSRYEAERALNPRLTYGQFVAANMIAGNHPGISAGDILNGLRNGRNIGQTLNNKGWDKKKIDKERKRIKDKNKDDRDYDDLDDYWRFGF